MKVVNQAIRVFVAACTVVVGCSAQNPGPKYPDVASFCSGRASAECGSQVLLACGIPAASSCVAKRKVLCLAAAPAGTSYNSGGAEACVNQVSTAYADARLTVAEEQAISGACAPVFDGPGVTGSSCQKDIDCHLSSGLRCVLAAGSAAGTCQTPQMVMGGGSCAAPQDQCISGFHCGLSAHCDVDAAAGETCSATLPCGPGLICPSSGTCVAKGADGTACATADVCLNGICNRASTLPTGVCVSQLTLAPNEPFCLES